MTKNGIPLVSVLIRSMARPELEKAIESVANQKWPNIELLVVNASGKFHSPLPKYSNIRCNLINSEEPLHRSDAANILLNNASGDYLIFLDDDDWFAPEHIERLVLALETDRSYILAYAGVDCINDDGHSIRIYDEAYDPSRLRLENYIPIHAALFRGSIVKDNHEVRFDRNLDLFEDWDFWLQCQSIGCFLHIQGISAYYRIQDGHGEGVNTLNAERSIIGLNKIASKWKNKYSASQFVDILARARHLNIAQVEINKLQKILSEKLHEFEQMNSSNSRLSEEFIQIKKEHDQIFEINQNLIDQNNCLQQERHDLRNKIEKISAEKETLKDQLSQAIIEIEEIKIQLHVCLAEKNSTEENSKKLIAHIKNLDSYIQSIWKSKSWSITKPARQIGKAYRSLIAFTYSALLKTGLRLYRSNILRPIFSLISPELKRKIYSRLLIGASTQQPILHNVCHDSYSEKAIDESSLVSIVIPVYNHAQYLERCIKSALSQTWKETEIIIVNDASTDEEVDRILSGFEHEGRVKILTNPINRGICATQNNALIASKGKIIAFLDCDDFLREDAIEKCMELWEKDTVYLHTGRINIDENDQEINRINFTTLPRKDYFLENLEAMYATHLKLIRRDVFAKVGLFDERFDSAQDYEMLMRISFHYPSSSFVHQPEFVYFHRIHAAQTTEKQRTKQNNLTNTIQQEARLRASIRNGKYNRFISFIMLSYGKHSQTLRAIKGLKETVKIPHEIILYDNGSSSETVDFIKKEIDGKFEGVKTIYGERNLGPAQGRRAALEFATGEWFIVFDNDEIPEPGWIEELLLRAESNDNVGAVCCRVVFPDGKLQFSGGKVIDLGDDQIDLSLYDRGSHFQDLESCVFRQVDWCPIGATLFTKNVAQYLHEGYPNAFEDSGVSYALKKEGLKLLNAPGALVWHDHITFQPAAEMREQYMKDRYNPKLMLRSISSFFIENGKIIHDDYVWRENGLTSMTKAEIIEKITSREICDYKF